MHGQVKILAGSPGSGKTERLIAAYRAFLKDRQTEPELKDRQTEPNEPKVSQRTGKLRALRILLQIQLRVLRGLPILRVDSGYVPASTLLMVCALPYW